MGQVRVVISGVGAAGMACARMMLDHGVGDIIAVDRAGALWDGRTDHMTPPKQWLAERTNAAS